MNIPVETSPDKIKLKSNEKKILTKIKKTDEWEKIKDIKDLYNEIKDYNIDKEDIGIKCAKWLNESGKDGELEISELYNSCYKLRPLKKKKEKELKTKEPKQPKGRRGSGGKETKEELKKKIEDTDKKQERSDTQLNNEEINNAIKEAVEKSKDDNGKIDPFKLIVNMGSTANYVFGVLCSQSGYKLLSTIMNTLQNFSNIIDINNLGWDSTKERAWLISKKLLGRILKTIIDCSGLALTALTKYLYDNGWDIFTGSRGSRNGEQPPNTNFTDEDEDDDGGGGGVGSGLPQRTGVLRRSPTGNLTFIADDVEGQRVAQQQQQQQQQSPEQQQRQNILRGYYNQLRNAVNTKLESDIRKTDAFTDKKKSAEETVEEKPIKSDLVNEVERQADNLGGVGGLFGLASYMFSNNIFRNVNRPPAPLGATRQAGRSEGVAPENANLQRPPQPEEPVDLQRQRADTQRTQNLERERLKQQQRQKDLKEEWDKMKENEEAVKAEKSDFKQEMDRQIEQLSRGTGGGLILPTGFGGVPFNDDKVVDSSLSTPLVMPMGIQTETPLVMPAETQTENVVETQTLQRNQREQEDFERRIRILMEMENAGDVKVTPEQAKVIQEEKERYEKIQQEEDALVDKMLREADQSIATFQRQTDFNMEQREAYDEEIRRMNEMYGTEPPEEMRYNTDLMFETPPEIAPRGRIYPLRLGAEINTPLGRERDRKFGITEEGRQRETIAQRTNTLASLQRDIREQMDIPTDAERQRAEELVNEMANAEYLKLLQQIEEGKEIDFTPPPEPPRDINPISVNPTIQVASLQRLYNEQKREPDAPDPILPVSVSVKPNNPEDNSLQQKTDAEQTTPLARPARQARDLGRPREVWRTFFNERLREPRGTSITWSQIREFNEDLFTQYENRLIEQGRNTKGAGGKNKVSPEEGAELYRIATENNLVLNLPKKKEKKKK